MQASQRQHQLTGIPRSKQQTWLTWDEINQAIEEYCTIPRSKLWPSCGIQAIGRKR